MTPGDILTFWFEELKPEQWWKKDAQTDALISRRFAALHRQAARCELFDWRRSAAGRLAEIIILDQFSRNMYRGDSRAFAQDGVALALAQEAVARKMDLELPLDQRAFLYMPYMHSESARIHAVAEQLFRTPGLESNLRWELKHRQIIARFGRYPHRNAILGRQSTPEEEAFLKEPGSSF